MLFSTLFTTALCLAGVSAKTHSFARSLKPSRMADPYASLQARAVPDSESSATRTVMPAANQQSKKHIGLTLKMHAILSQCRHNVAKHVDKIKHHCRKTESRQVILTSIMIELEAMLVIFKETVTQTRACSHTPTPSQTPTTTPRTINEVIEIVLQIIILVKITILEMLEFIDEESVRGQCGDILLRLTSTVSEIIVAVNVNVQGSITILSQIGAHALKSVQSFGFGFEAILEVVQTYSS
ncbi:secreted protein [Melampsora americana]|nr:secreted protein [Melampsora americana]